MIKKVKELIEESNKYTFSNNSYRDNRIGGVYSRPTPAMHAWIAECEDFLLTNYGKNSAPWKIFIRFDVENIEDNDQADFDKEKNIIVSALTSCLRISPKTTTSKQIKTKELDLTKVFIVHGHDKSLKEEVARFIEKLKLKPIILHEEPSSGNTIIEKIEKNSNVGFGIVLYTPCDTGASQEDSINIKSRARQNVVFEHGYLIGKIGRQNVCALVKGEIEKPNDISGVVYIPIAGDWKISLAKELRSSGYIIDMNLVI